MQPLSQCPARILAKLEIILLDLDDTLSWKGLLPGCAYGALEILQQEGLGVALITGRPAGWCDHIARMWPVNGVVGENGAFFFHYDRSSRKMERQYWRTTAQRKADRKQLEAIESRILAEVPGAAVATDQAYRESDFAIDHCEDVPALPGDQIDRIVEIFQQAGATAKISSIHVNGWFGDFDKLGMTKRMIKRVFSIDLEADRTIATFVGDSPNDAPMFDYFPDAIGVANVRRFLDTLEIA
ncbi:MAG: HAD family hydrolase, partial [Acidiferrobacteraceae bacterium]|nr:HAD family hydrolase [Acidiferrobacteraceae bacterium]